MNNTKPEVRVNKLGVPVTKHVLIDPKANSSKTILPPVPNVVRAPVTGSPEQLRMQDVVLSGRLFPADERLSSLLDQSEKTIYKFNACEAEIFAVMSVTDLGNAFALLEIGMRTADEARDHLYEIGASDLIHDRSALMQELLERGIPYDKSAYVLQKEFDAESSPYCADALEFYAWKGSVGVETRRLVCSDIIDGKVRLDDLKTIDMDKLDSSERVEAVTSSLAKFSSKKKKPYTLADMSKLLDLAARDQVDGEDIAATVTLLEKVGIEGVEKLEDVYRFVSHHWELKASVKDPIEASYYATLVSEGMERAGVKLDDTYLSTTFPTEVIALRKNKIGSDYATALLSNGLVAEEAVAYVKLLESEDITPDEALPLISDGKTAHEIIGIHNGINTHVADGWL
jgi:hypothetical protein